MGLFRTVQRAWSQYREFQAVLAELNGYSDRELADIGLARGDAARVAYEEAERRVGARRGGRDPARGAAPAAART